MMWKPKGCDCISREITARGLCLFLVALMWGVSSGRTQDLQSGDLRSWARNPGRRGLRVEEWFDIPGERVEDLTSSERFPRRPDRSIILRRVQDRVEMKSDVDHEFGRRLKGWFHAPLSGEYRFRLCSDDHSRLWLRVDGKRRKLVDLTSHTKKLEWDRSPKQRSASVRLERGKAYEMEILMKENQGGDHLAAGVELPDGRAEFPMRARRFATPPESISFEADTDGDGLSDYEEWVMGSDPENVSTANDGVSDRVKAAMNRDPRRTMSVAPDFPVEWYLKHRIRLRPDSPWGDEDGDGLLNLEEARHGGDPHRRDTSGDGVSDFAAVHLFQVSADRKLPMDSLVLTTRLHSNGFLRGAGIWEKNKKGLYRTTSSNGDLTYVLPFPKREPSLLALDLEVEASEWESGRVWIEIRLGDRPVVRQPITQPPGERGTAWFVLPPGTEPGWREVTFAVENLDEDRSVLFRELRLYRVPPGDDDWLDHWRAASLSVDPVKTSRISPACVEGDGLYPDFLEAERTGPGETLPLEARPLPDDRWYVDIPLPEDGTLAEAKVRHPLAGREEIVRVRWEPINLLEEAPPRLRVGDALRITAHPADQAGGRMRVRIGETVHPWRDPTAPLVARFEEAGEFRVEVEWEGKNESSRQERVVRVMDAGFKDAFIIRWPERPYTTSWEWTIEKDDLRVFEVDARLRTSETPLGAAGDSGREVGVVPPGPGRFFMALRTSENGSVLASRRLEKILTRDSRHTDVHAVHGSRPVDRTVTAPTYSRIPRGFSVKFSFIHPERWIFADGATEMTATARDVDPCGRVPLYFYQRVDSLNKWIELQSSFLLLDEDI